MSSKDQRRSERHLINQLLRVRDCNSAHLMGNLVNLSHHGFMLISPQPLTQGLTTEISLELPYAVDGQSSVSFKARCVWCQKSSYSDDYGAGFEIEDITEPDRRKLQVLFGSQ